ncbi:hypothetical protein SLW70_11980 [Flavobacterium sp. NG2]|uniref:hypothetical protein n=1 Tax=Flavobacterium sp. NG2 TaxID=3097547 RepID=UPI002A7ED7BA|nr:hypothetical protein [Flavobacterium sp. NG2]WPR70650.1 hypothetical protein SLW70_11980 [Flavobacterium sp. NG2]
MADNKFEILKNNIQEVIDLIATKDTIAAGNKLINISEQLDEMLDFAEEDEDLIQISKYQVLLNQLLLKVNPIT